MTNIVYYIVIVSQHSYIVFISYIESICVIYYFYNKPKYIKNTKNLPSRIGHRR